ncbi:hypothetical protein Goshw_003669 [Gossypium schwendimanii]|uniref:Uncharacterized protein n=1 Tax=Gossypium schwendimanii TaxID=34291 RepID=A0A7J9LTB7_GOSSC|nr:hypothetical protein [Gossypium schwendimanii]
MGKKIKQLEEKKMQCTNIVVITLQLS